MESIWHEFVQRARAKNVAIVAHSFGGICTLEVVRNYSNIMKTCPCNIQRFL